MSESRQEQFKRINNKLQQLLKQYQLLQKENRQLQADLVQIRKREKEMTDKIGGFEQQLAALKLATGDLSERDKQEIEKRLNQYIREIDRCIAMMSEQA